MEKQIEYYKIEPNVILLQCQIPYQTIVRMTLLSLIYVGIKKHARLLLPVPNVKKQYCVKSYTYLRNSKQTIIPHYDTKEVWFCHTPNVQNFAQNWKFFKSPLEVIGEIYSNISYHDWVDKVLRDDFLPLFVTPTETKTNLIWLGNISEFGIIWI